MIKITRNIFIVLIAVTLASCGSKADKKPLGASNLQAKGYLATPQPFNNDLVTTAELIASEQLELMAPMAGQVLEIYFKEGQKIQKGARIIRLDDRIWKAQLLGVRADLSTAEKDYKRKKQLLEVEGSSQGEIDKAFSTVETLKSQLQQLQVNIDLANVVAPFSGELGMRNFSKGAFLKQGDVITTLTELNHLKVDFTLAQEHLKDVKIGKKVLVLVDTDSLEAEIYAVNPLVNAQSRTIGVRARLQQTPKKTIMPGTFAEVKVSTNFIKDALLIPTQAIVPEINDQTVYLYKNGKAEKRVVKMGNRTADKVHILEGINAGDTVITTGMLQIKDGMEIVLSWK